MMLSGSWTFTEIGPYFGAKAGNNATWDWAPLPSTNSGVPAGVYPLSVGGAYSINKDSKNPAGAAAFLNFIASGPSRQLNALAAVGQEPTPIKLAAGEFPASTDPRMKRQYLLLNATKNFGYTTWTFWPAKSDTYIYQQMDKVLVGQLTPKDYCAGLDSVFQQEFKAGKTPPVPADGSVTAWPCSRSTGPGHRARAPPPRTGGPGGAAPPSGSRSWRHCWW